MQKVLAGSILVYQCAQGRQTVAFACCVFVAGQCCLSYLVAGVGKLSAPAWRDGSALRALATHSFFGRPIYRKWFLSPRIATSSARFLIAIECLFPVVLALPVGVVVAFVAWGVMFHGLNAVFMGLGQYFWAWIASYPCLLFLSAAGSAS
jgi:hypothetical protein